MENSIGVKFIRGLIYIYIMVMDVNMSQDQVQTPETQVPVQDIITLMRTAKFLVLKVPKSIYCPLRSFVESSLKLEYLWNRPKIITNSYTKFQKCRKNWCWELILRLKERTAILTIFVKNMPFFTIKYYNTAVYVNIQGTDVELIDGQFEPVEDVIYATPVSFHDIRHRIEKYIDIAQCYEPTIITLQL